LTRLFAIERGSVGVPIVFLHGFGGSHRAWSAVLEGIAPERRVILYDLPGHAGSLAVQHGSAAVAARAVLADLDRRAIARAEIVGHSMGGAASALVALRAPDRVAALTLLAPGGFGREINAPLLRRYAAATAAADLAILLAEFFGHGFSLPLGFAEEQAEERQAPGASEALLSIVETFFDGAEQKVLPLDALWRLPMPIRVAWGGEDRVLPVNQARRLPERIAVRIFEGVGHMLPLESPAEVARLILESRP
jgi:pyruvate dehydrogenase E2 component (dihydrolipoamide acetyltransferase)